MLGRLLLTVAMTTGYCQLASAAQPSDPAPEIAAVAEKADLPEMADGVPLPTARPVHTVVAVLGPDPAVVAGASARIVAASLTPVRAAAAVDSAAEGEVAALAVGVPVPRPAPARAAADPVVTAAIPVEPAANPVETAAPPAESAAPVATAAPAAVEAAPAAIALAPAPATEALPGVAVPADADASSGHEAAAAAQSELGKVAEAATPGSGKPDLDRLIAAYADEHDVPEALVRRVVKRESNFNPAAYNSGNWGLMQIRHGTAKAMGYRGPAKGLLDAETNLAYAVKYLAGAYKVARGNADRAVRLYASGYYYEAKRMGLLEETGLRGGAAAAPVQTVSAIAGGMY
ncbi:lytic transglycosylase domain-containing protein [Methylobrevis albus]|uniref:Lytic transglycosylase domain-containing protein n=1 Tax=Methylobrevis albus TaxID=2793297 RepID=A0A931I3T6_9HYPH|nr:lytic transglycosylase domain-containing protein [Methylobrevis albus]MBH0238741.1 lytic transglycosylase domain-containing protein [Methylobrevis albus]